jgi:hypothetical protein
MECIDMAQDRDRWWAFVKAAMNFQFLCNAGNFFTT